MILTRRQADLRLETVQKATKEIQYSSEMYVKQVIQRIRQGDNYIPTGETYLF